MRVPDADCIVRQTLTYPDRRRPLFPPFLLPFYVHHLSAIGRRRDARTAVQRAVLFLRRRACELLTEIPCVNTTITTTGGSSPSGGTRSSWNLIELLFVPRVVLRADLRGAASRVECDRREHAQHGHERPEEALDAPALRQAVCHSA